MSPVASRPAKQPPSVPMPHTRKLQRLLILIRRRPRGRLLLWKKARR